MEKKRRATEKDRPETWQVKRARIAATKRHHPESDVTDELRELKALKAEEFVHQWVTSAPAPTSEQIERLRSLLPAAANGHARSQAGDAA